MPRSASSVIGPRGSGFVSTNFDAFSSLMASRRPTRIWPGSNTVSAPGLPPAARYIALIGSETGRHIGRGIHRQPGFLSGNRPAVFRLAAVVERIPQREWNAGEALPADAPIAVQSVHPVFVARPHVFRVPLHLP